MSDGRSSRPLGMYTTLAEWIETKSLLTPSYKGLEPVAKASCHDIDVLLRLHVTVRQRQHYPGHSANNSRVRDQCRAGDASDHSQHLVHRRRRTFEEEKRKRHSFVRTMITNCLFPELLLDSPRAEIREKADLHRLHSSLLWLWYVSHY